MATPGRLNAPGESPSQRAALVRAERSPRLISDTPISVPKLRWANVHLQYRGQSIQGKYMPLDNLDIRLDIVDGNVSLHPLSFGVGSAREGSVLWSPDSKRFAYVSSSQTTVYLSSGKSFTKINLPLDQPPGKESDPQIRGAVLGDESVTPTRWAKADTLILERFYHYAKLNPSSGWKDVVRTYEITVSFKDDGTANTSWKLREDR